MNVDTMLKDPQTQRYAQRRTHRTYTSQFKAELVAMCQKPGASIAAVALQHGMNANLLHRWRKEWAQGLHCHEGGVTTAVATPQSPAFLPEPAPSRCSARPCRRVFFLTPAQIARGQ
jgi:transposase-like protein